MGGNGIRYILLSRIRATKGKSNRIRQGGRDCGIFDQTELIIKPKTEGRELETNAREPREVQELVEG